jgi:adenylate kinase family enzyme
MSKVQQLRIVILGGPGSGTTTLAQSLAARFGIELFESDFFLWKESSKLYSQKRNHSERIQKICRHLDFRKSWIVPGSLGQWGDCLKPHTTAVIFLDVPRRERLKRLRNREVSRFGKDIEYGGIAYPRYLDFLKMAAAYDQGTFPLRRHKAEDLNWLSSGSGMKLHLNGTNNLATMTREIIQTFQLESFCK